MLQIQSVQDIEAAQLPIPLGALIEHILAVELSISKTTTLDPDCGQIILLQESDTDQALIERLGQSLSKLPFESVQYIAGADAYFCRLLRDNECMINLIIPNHDWVATEWKSILDKYEGREQR